MAGIQRIWASAVCSCARLCRRFAFNKLDNPLLNLVTNAMPEAASSRHTGVASYDRLRPISASAGWADERLLSRCGIGGDRSGYNAVHGVTSLNPRSSLVALTAKDLPRDHPSPGATFSRSSVRSSPEGAGDRKRPIAELIGVGYRQIVRDLARSNY